MATDCKWIGAVSTDITAAGNYDAAGIPGDTDSLFVSAQAVYGMGAGTMPAAGALEELTYDPAYALATGTSAGGRPTTSPPRTSACTRRWSTMRWRGWCRSGRATIRNSR